ncbi:YcnI family protein [Nocardia sp. alder85J]|uniref:YcnI family copper-binding membrane protein n=1 Tax=Nocardia sp. alder85J TaxID=2862949 RepID=UPI001CD2DAC7|nr:YcnI family protein [Nocardia sp. alder85J]MCX4096582.1 YcnI family protein [Nocardia sp. alder85J]
MSVALSRALLATGAAAGLTLLAAGTAAAHVTVDAPGASQGGYGYLTFRVPTESETASTTKLSVQLPAVSSALTEPLAGWTTKIDKNDKNQVTAVTWTADPGNPGVGPGHFQRFVLSVGPLPKQASVSFPAAQTYSDGKVVNWNEPMSADGKEPENPAPMLALAPSKGGDGDDDHMSAAPATADHDGNGSDDTARWLGGIGLVLGALGAALGLGSVLRGRRS